eukprot:GFKZ01010877.1.p1 GENE.GFKZ01010877.1~~GFKZ01010877.1.p1  ORF type:complete len:155 (+),score=18.43 GFKZ01010877.1:310-774(+)
MFRPAGIACNKEVPALVPSTSLRPADILVPCGPDPTDTLDAPMQMAYDVTFRNSLAQTLVKKAASQPSGAADAAYEDNLKKFDRFVRHAYQVTTEAPFPKLSIHFVPLAFDALAAPAKATAGVPETHVKVIATRQFSTPPVALEQLRQKIAAAI